MLGRASWLKHRCLRKVFISPLRSSLLSQVGYGKHGERSYLNSALGAAAMQIQAIVVESFGGPEVLTVGSKELPAIGAGQVRVKVEASGVNPSDTYLRLGPHGPYAAVPHLLPALPWTPGRDGAGVVEDVAPDVKNVSIGQRVYVCGAGTGTCATHMLCDATGVFPLPDRVSFAQGACVGVPCATAFYALKFRAKATEGQSVFIHGASGAVGLAAVQIAKHLGCRVVGTAGTEPGVAAVSAAGADAAVNHRESGYLEKCKEHAPGGFDVVLEMAAHANLAADLTLAGRRSCVCIVGSKAEAASINPRALMPTEIDVRGVFLGAATEEEKAEIHRALYDLMASGALAPVVSLQLPLRDAAKAHVEVMQPSAGGAAGNVVLLPGAESSL